MNLLFVHDTLIKVDENNVLYTSGSYNQEVWQRYLNICSNLTVIGREEKKIYSEKIAKRKFNLLNEQIKFVPIPNRKESIKTFLNFNIKVDEESIIEQQVINNDFFIIRLPSNAGNVAIKYIKKYKKPFLVEVVGCPFDSLWNHSIKGKIIAPWNALVMKNKVKNAPFVLYVTNTFLQNRYPTKGNSIGCSDVSLNKVDSSVIEKRLEKISELNTNQEIRIGTTAAIDVKYKGQKNVIIALNRLKRNGLDNFKYELVGGGSSKYLKEVAVENKIEDKVYFLGAKPFNQVMEWLDSIDIYIQPSMTEGLSRAVIEAMSRGLPVIGSDAGGTPELLESNAIIRAGSHSDIVLKLSNLDKNELKKQAIRNFEESKKYDINLLNQKRNDFYQLFREYSLQPKY